MFFAAFTYSFVLSESVCARTPLAVVCHSTSKSAIIRTVVDGLKYAAISISTMIGGIASRVSAILMTIMSYIPPINAAETPSTSPIVHVMAATDIPKRIEVRSDHKSSLAMS